MQIELPDGASPGGQVAFDSELGRGIARWEGPPCQPAATAHVELDVAEVLRWGATIELTPSDTAPLLAVTGTTTRVRGTIVDVDGDALDLRVGGELVLLEVSDTPSSTEPGGCGRRPDQANRAAPDQPLMHHSTSPENWSPA
jgi:hypothetical protein